jgi:hypothetical protein
MKVGSLVKCIVQIPKGAHIYIKGFGMITLPEYNQEYIVRELMDDHIFDEDANLTLLLEEIINPTITCQGCGGQLEYAFPRKWFTVIQNPDELSEELQNILQTAGTLTGSEQKQNASI